jgi:glycosyltransferase involved in cell wall biosynthesis
VVVNLDLKKWCDKYLFTKKVTFLPNFASLAQKQESQTVLKGTAGKRMVMVANLHYPKNHLFVLKAFIEMNVAAQGWTLHFIGKVFNNSYSDEIIDLIKTSNAVEHVFLYDVCADIENILSQSEIGILASTHEGFPVSILEYAQSKLAVVSTNVGYCSTIIEDNVSGFLFDPLNANDFKKQLEKCIFGHENRFEIAKVLHDYCKDRFSEETVINQLVNLYSNILK